MKALSLTDQTTVDRARHFATALATLSQPRGILVELDCRAHLHAAAMNLLVALRKLDGELEARAGESKEGS